MKTKLLNLFLGCSLLFSSCIVSKKVVYVNDMRPDTTYSALAAPALTIQNGDRISIIVSAKTPELAVPFNQISGTYQVNEQGDINSAGSAGVDVRGYLVDDIGNIEFPILGTMPVAGKTLEEVKTLVKNRLSDEKLINNPIVNVELLNLKVNMMGEVNKVGLLTVPDGRITLMEAISRSGGLTVNAASDRITVIREQYGVRKMIVSDIRTKDIFNSPAYFLQQNDIVYIEPKDAEPTPKVQQNWRYISTGIGLVATIFTILNFLK